MSLSSPLGSALLFYYVRRQQTMILRTYKLYHNIIYRLLDCDSTSSKPCYCYDDNMHFQSYTASPPPFQKYYSNTDYVLIETNNILPGATTELFRQTYRVYIGL